MYWHKRRITIKTEEKAKIVASFWGKNLFNSCAVAVLLRTILNNRMNSTRRISKKRMNSSYSSKSAQVKQLARQRIENILPPQTGATTFAFSSVFILLLCQYMRTPLAYSRPVTLKHKAGLAAIAQLYVTKFSTISLYLTNLYVTQSFAIASYATYCKIRQDFSNSVCTRSFILCI